ncbi:Ribokinase-like protein [Apiospora phragmitis]|uniref:Ribokinase-like protein n=1 Tax=Apiospora phragmitis TaxID=2905665 RepID=A0ABR1W756_9PEZI
MVTSSVPDRNESVQAIEYRKVLVGKWAGCAIATWRTCHKKPRRDGKPVEGEQCTCALEQLSSLCESNISVKMIGAVGDDLCGRKLITQLKEYGVDTYDVYGVVTVPDARSSICFALLEHPTDNDQRFLGQGATPSGTQEHVL